MTPFSNVGKCNYFISDCFVPFERLVTEKHAIDACGVYSVAMACDIQIQTHWPKIWEKDQQENYMNSVFNLETPRFYASLLWANVKHSSKKRFQTRLFAANHFTLLTNVNFTINRLNKDEGDERAPEEETVEEAKDETSVTKQEEKSISLASGESLKANDEKEEEQGKQESEQRGRLVKAPRPIAYEDVTSDDQSGTKFRHWRILREEALQTQEQDVLPNMKGHAATDKHGKVFVLDAKSNRRKLLNKNRLHWGDFEGQYINGKPNIQVFIRENKDEEYKQDKTLTFDKDLLHIIYKDNGQPIPPEIEADALVLHRYDSFLKADRRCKRKITAFFAAPPEEKILLDRMVYEYWGKFPGYIPYGNTKVHM